MSVRLELTLRGQAMDARLMTATLSDLLTLLRGLESAQHPGRVRHKPSPWTFSELSLGSLNGALEPLEPTADDELAPVALSAVSGLRLAEETEALPDRWDQAASQRAVEITRRLGDSKASGLHLRVLQGGKETAACDVTRQASVNLRSAMKPAHESIGSATGILGSISVHRSRRAGLWLDRGPRVSVTFTEDRQTQIKQALGERVTISGRLKRNKTGQLLTINMRNLLVLGPRPRLADLIGADPDLTGGLTVQDHLRELRG